MTQTNFRKTNQSENRTPNATKNYYNKSEQETIQSQANNESLAIIPVEVWQPDNSQKRLGIKAKTNALAEDLAALRSNIDVRINQLQSLIETEGAAAERAELLNEITSHIRESLNLKDIFKTVVEDARSALQTDRVVVYQFDKNWKGTVIAESVDSNWPQALGAEIADPCFADRYVESYQKGRVKATADIYEAGLTECHISQLETFAVRANLVAPIVANGKLLGLLIAHHCSEPRQWIESEIEFFQQLATQLGYAVDQALLLTKQKAATQQAQRLNHINVQIRKSPDIQEILTISVEETREALGCERVVIYEFDSQWKGKVIAESVDSNWPQALGAEIADPCFADRYVKPYERGRVKATENIYEAGLTECHINQLEPFEVKANLVAPVVVEQKLIGLLIGHQCTGPRAWTELEIDLIRKVAVQVGYALEQAYLLQKQQAAAKQARFLNEIGIKIRNSQRSEDIFDTIVEEARSALQADRVILYQFDADWIGTVVAESVDKAWPQAFGKKISEPCFKKNYLKSYLRGRVSTIENIDEAGLGECHVGLLEPFAVKANIVAPIIAEQKLHGLLIVHQCSGPRKWEESEVDFTKQLATQVGFALDQVTLLQQQQAATKQAIALNQISSNIRKSLSPQDILNTTVEDMQEAIQADRVIVYEFDPQWQGTVVAESVTVGFPEALGAEIVDPCFAQGYVKPYLKGRVKPTNDIREAGFTECHIKQLEKFKVKANLVAPIVTDKKLYGLLIAHQCSAPRNWEALEIDLIKQVAIQVGYALDQAFLLQQQQEATQQARLLSEISSRIRESLELEKIFQTTVEESLLLMKADRIVIYRFDDNWEGKIISESVRPNWSKIAEVETEVPCFPTEYVEPYRQGRVQVTADINKANLTDCHREQLEKWQVKANVVVPILVGQKLYGLLGAHQCSGTRQWQDSEVEVFKQLALQVGSTLEQALLLEQVIQARKTAENISEEQQKGKELLESQIETFLTEIENSFDGDLTVRANVTAGVMGTVADFFNAAIENLQQLALKVKSATNIVSSTTEGNNAEIEKLSGEAHRQAEAIANALGQIQVMTNAVKTVAANAQQAEAKVQQANQILQTSDAAMNRSVEGIVVIQKTVEATARKVKNLGETSKKISRVLSLINDLANQTNILALNASVEATRAGKDDQGFATVASEVRSLAEQSASATQEIEQIVEEMQSGTSEVVKAMVVGRKRVMVGTQLVKGARQTLTDLLDVSGQISELVEEITLSATTQADTSSKLSETMQDVAAIANQTSEQSMTVTESFSKLLGVAGDLEKSVAEFKVN
ncbi:MAG: GAF domain-containing protein [Okeania sp. SIO3B5]|uniref:GAF domain-containing protein n=1 Tax=Okeania sp. SIO3B5 TaxID=2607811 RepID=UPI0014006D98|nr:GAF domain-containing protein [Okeania sp. SIO3B5]NEO54236.1 GAF domain-containing protein [Okeania sp. SIO3B5]